MEQAATIPGSVPACPGTGEAAMLRNAVTAATAVLVFVAGAAQAQVDEEAAQALTKKAKCTKCHSVDKKKDGPSYQETAAKYKGKADGPEKLFKHLTTAPMVEVDGKKEEHTAVKAGEAEIKNPVGWILSR